MYPSLHYLYWNIKLYVQFVLPVVQYQYDGQKVLRVTPLALIRLFVIITYKFTVCFNISRLVLISRYCHSCYKTGSLYTCRLMAQVLKRFSNVPDKNRVGNPNYMYDNRTKMRVGLDVYGDASILFVSHNCYGRRGD